MKKPQLFVGKIAASLFCLALLSFTGSVLATDNTGSGGTITYTDSTGSNAVSTPPYIGGFVVHKFTVSGNLTIPSNTNATILVVAGGGGGGSKYGDGGGAGGLIYTTNTLVGGSNYSVTIGTGGAGGGSGANANGTTGSNSVFNTLTALGGGGGGSGFGGNLAGLAGGSGGGGGGGSAPFTGGAGNQPGSASGGFGNAGTTGSGSVYGGGGGAGAAASSFSGGNGLQYNIIGVPTYYAGGGAGINGGGSGGLGGGGNPGSGNLVPGSAGAANTGGGGGGGFNQAGGSGGSGIVIVRYAYDPGLPTVAVTSPSVAIAGGGSISATATVGAGVPPYSVTYHYKATTSGTFINVGPAGPFGATNAFAQTMGVLTNGSYNIYATVADSVANATTSVTNTFTVFAVGNTGSGGTIVYTDTNGLNPVVGPPYVGGYVVQTFTSNNTLIIPSSLNADVLVVAGGGGGGGKFGDGGGAGGLVYSNLSLSGASYAITVGDGGNGTAGNTSGANEANSAFDVLLTALGGGGGGNGYPNNVGGQNGGSGGGGGGGSGNVDYTAGTGQQPGSASGGFGNNGYTGGAGGGVYGGGGGAGVAPTSETGGDGLPYAICGVTNYYAGGGAGINGAGVGGLGGGGNPGLNGFTGDNGAANTGGGGGGGFNNRGGNGGSGIVIIRYPFSANPPVSVLLSSPTNTQNFVAGVPISTTVFVAGGSPPYSVTYHYKLTTSASYTAAVTVGPFGATNTFAQTFGALPEGVYQVYATVFDNTSGTANSGTNTFTVYAAGNTGLGGTVTYTDTNGLNPVAAPPYAGGYVVQTFTANGTLTLPSTLNVDVLVVGGGGGGGGKYGCGGGAGGLIYTNLPLSGGTYSATVGAGGNGTASGQQGVNGNNSVLSTLTALGGGGGGTGYNSFGGPSEAGQDGGSGGGGGGGTTNFGAGTGLQPASASGGFGNNGYTSGDGTIYGNGGGAGAAATINNAGDGLQYAISGVPTYYAGGGGGLAGTGTTTTGGGGDGPISNGPGGNGAANTGGGGGGGWNASGGSGGSGIIIVRYPYVHNPPLAVAVTSPADGQSILKGSSISATALVGGVTSPYSVIYHYKLTTAGSYTAAAAVGPFGGTNTFAQTLGTLPAGVYQVYATVTDVASGTTNSATNTFTVSLTTTLAVQDANFETPGVPAGSSALGWAAIAAVWNPGVTNNYFQQNSVSQSPNAASEQFSSTCAGGVDWYVLLSSTASISQDLLTTVNVGDTLSLTFYGGRGLGGSSTSNGGVFTATMLVGSTTYSMPVDTTVLTNGTWQSYTLTQIVANSGELSLQFSWVSGYPWLDNISVTRTLSSLAVPPVLGEPKVSGGNLIVTGTGGTPGADYTWLNTTNLSTPIAWTTNSTGTLDGTGAFSNAIPVNATQPARFFRLRVP